MFLPILKSFLVTVGGQDVELNPKHCNVVNVPYPSPAKFSFAWCKEKFQYFRKFGFFMRLKERSEWNAKVDLAILKTLADYLNQNDLPISANTLYSLEKNLKEELKLD
jgi:hypothetical protein